MDGNEAQENQELPPRRDFLKRVLAAAGAGAVLDESVLGQVGTKPFVVPSSNSTIRIQTESDIGTLWPFVEKLSTRAEVRGAGAALYEEKTWLRPACFAA